MEDLAKPPNGRPKIRPPLSAMEWLLALATFVGTLFTIIILMVNWSALPASIPSHFGVSGQVDAYGPKGGPVVLAILSVVFAIGFTVLCRYPWVYNYPQTITEANATQQYRLAQSVTRWVGLEGVAVFAYLEWAIIQDALGKPGDLGVWFVPLVILLPIATVVISIRAAVRS